ARVFRCLRFDSVVTLRDARLAMWWDWLSLPQRDFHPQDWCDLSWRTETISTLRYLHRNGYQEGDSITLVSNRAHNGSTLASAIGAEFAELKDDDHAALFRPTTRWTERILNSFCIPELRQNRLAFAVPRLLLFASITLSVVCLCIGMIFFVKAFGESRHHDYLENAAKNYTLSATDTKNLPAARLFHYYRSKGGVDPLRILQTASRALSPEAVVTDMMWEREGSIKQTSSLALTLILNEKFFTDAKNPHRSDPKKITAYQEKAKRMITAFCPTCQIEWSKSPKKQTLSLKISDR
ncbi:MAG: hypothetical protein NTX76_03085, partial [Alphaproteobacteria bacterium]|nr:hypothetical protein [Alphaproteobacteria bacterium]